jgi:sterol desaturase/sphingolipid hydroxylase (fatty acid hydroxylase superfamily)
MSETEHLSNIGKIMTNTSHIVVPSSALRTVIRWGLYPASWALVLGSFHLLHTTHLDPRTLWAGTIGILACAYLILEFLFPYQARWSMSWRTFLADLKFVLLNTAFIAGFSAALALLTITISGTNSGDLSGFASNWPEPLQLAACLLIFEAINYTLHRAMHRATGHIGRFLWRSHAAHHLPPRLYLIMHAVFHPLNGILIQGLAITLPIWGMGYTENVVTMFLIINGMHGLISHFNVDVRMGWANYLFVGTELHRYHHSANVDEAQNFGATLSIFDQLFGTFVYRPGIAPDQLGVKAELGLPPYERYFCVLLLPFRNNAN